MDTTSPLENVSEVEQNREKARKNLLSLFCSNNDIETLNRHALVDYWASKFLTVRQSNYGGDYTIIAIEDRQIALKTLVWYFSCLGLDLLETFGSTDSDGIFRDSDLIGRVIKKTHPHKIEGTASEVKDKIKSWRKVVSTDFTFILWAQIEVDQKRKDPNFSLDVPASEVPDMVEANYSVRQRFREEIEKQAKIFLKDRAKKRAKKEPEIEDENFKSCIEVEEDPLEAVSLIDPLINTDTTYDDSWLKKIGIEE